MPQFARGGIVSLLALASIMTGLSAADLSIKPGDQIIVVDVQNEKQLQTLLDLDLDIWSHEYGVGAIDVHASVDERKKLQDAGVTAELIAVKGEGHGWSGKTATKTTQDAVKFLDEHLKGKK